MGKTKRILVTLGLVQYNEVKKLDHLGSNDSEIVRTIVSMFLEERKRKGRSEKK